MDDKHVVFGQVINGMEVVREIGKIPTDANERPRVKILIFDCGDYDTRRIHLREDVFKETIQSILEDRARKEKVKLLGPEEAEKYKKLKQKSAFDIEQEYPEEDTIKKKESEDDDSEEEDCEVKIKFPWNFFKPSFNAVIASISKWFVGSSKIKKFAPDNIIFAKTHLTFSPPEITFADFKASSPENNILPKNPLTYVSSGSFEYFLNHSVKLSSVSNK